MPGARRPAGACAVALLGLWLAACSTNFEDPAQVIDLRLLAMRAEPPEILTPFDPDDPTAFDITEVGDIEICSLVADPSADRELAFRMTACPPVGNGRCEGDNTIDLGQGMIDDPERAAEPVRMCGTLSASGNLVAVIQESLSADDLAGFGGVRVQIEIEVTPADGEPSITGFKRVTYGIELPAERTPNRNPDLEGITGIRPATGQRGLDFEVPLGRCGDIEPWPVAPGERVTLLPREPNGAREVYLVPTFDGGSQTFTENLRYQWMASDGDFSRFNSGGERDGAGNSPPLDSSWRAPRDLELIGDGLDVRMWIVQRDERGGQTWFESCARVIP